MGTEKGVTNMKLCLSSWSLLDHIGVDFPLSAFPQVAKEQYALDAVELAQMHFAD